ncbi:MAG: hypothetical protein Q4F17_00230 [Eubacteriales bacterium]|nr:hypothetical protein [Eubacteriales bacterium]
MLYDQQAVQANIRNREGRRVFFLPRGSQLTSEARDWLTRERIDIRPGDQARILEYRLENGGVLREKPEHMTHLRDNILVEKTHPIIRFRGKMDTLQAILLLCQTQVRDREGQLGEILALARKIVACEVMEEPLTVETLCGLTMEEQRRRSHFPQEHYGTPHFMPQAADGAEMGWLNLCRCAAREAELAAAQALKREDIQRALNRMSSMLYLLMIETKAGRK